MIAYVGHLKKTDLEYFFFYWEFVLISRNYLPWLDVFLLYICEIIIFECQTLSKKDSFVDFH